jgi:hypothetical protein
MGMDQNGAEPSQQRAAHDHINGAPARRMNDGGVGAWNGASRNAGVAGNAGAAGAGVGGFKSGAGGGWDNHASRMEDVVVIEPLPVISDRTDAGEVHSSAGTWKSSGRSEEIAGLGTRKAPDQDQRKSSNRQV